jgi:hypothetical protein
MIASPGRSGWLLLVCAGVAVGCNSPDADEPPLTWTGDDGGGAVDSGVAHDGSTARDGSVADTGAADQAAKDIGAPSDAVTEETPDGGVFDGTSGPDDDASMDSGRDAGPPPLTGPIYTFGSAVDPGSCLDVLGNGSADGTPIDQYTCNASPAQSLMVVDAGNGNVKLVSASSKKCIDLSGGGTANGTKVQLYMCNGSPGQTFKLQQASGGFVNIVNPVSGRCLEVTDGNPANLTNVQLYDCNVGAPALWQAAPVGAGYTSSCALAQLQAGQVLAANCVNSSQALVPSTLDLSSCLTNSNGTLGWQNNGGFAGSCSSCQLTGGSQLSCQCNNVSAQGVSTSIDLTANINNCDGVLTCGACGSGTTSTGPTVFAGLYCADGNDCYGFSGQSSIANLKESGWNVLFVFAFSIQSNGDITAGSTPVVQNGVYVGDPNWGSNVAALKTFPTTVTRYEVTIGGWGNGSYDAVKSLIASEGTGSGSTLYRNFQALKAAVPGIDAINDDDEQTYDVGSSTAFGQMINSLGMKFTLVPYQNQGFWVQLKSNLGDACDIVYLQVYQGGAGNDPGQWNSAFGGGFRVVPGQESNTQNASQWATWASADGAIGGFYYPDLTWVPGANWGINYMANAMGLPPL